MFVFYMIKFPNCWHWIFARNTLIYFCSWRNFWIIYTSIYFFNQRFYVSINNIWYFIWYFISYWLNSNILSFSDGITILQKSLFLPTFSWDSSWFSFLKEWMQFKHWKSPWYFDVTPLKKVDGFLLQDNANLFFFRL